MMSIFGHHRKRYQAMYLLFLYFLTQHAAHYLIIYLWVQYVSSTPATRLEVITLQEQLDSQLQQRQARETGICPVREELYSQCFGGSIVLFCPV